VTVLETAVNVRQLSQSMNKQLDASSSIS